MDRENTGPTHMDYSGPDRPPLSLSPPAPGTLLEIQRAILAELKNMNMISLTQEDSISKPIVVFYINVVGVSSNKAKNYVDTTKSATKREDVISYYLPIRDGRETHIEVFMPGTCGCNNNSSSNNNRNKLGLDYDKIESALLENRDENSEAPFRECCEACDESNSADSEKKSAQ